MLENFPRVDYEYTGGAGSVDIPSRLLERPAWFIRDLARPIANRAEIVYYSERGLAGRRVSDIPRPVFRPAKGPGFWYLKAFLEQETL